MLTAYVRHNDGTTAQVRMAPHAQQLGVREGSVREARVFWRHVPAATPEEEEAQALLLSAVPLLDTLVLTRTTAARGERVVLHGLVTEAGTDGQMISLSAADDPKVDRLHDAAFRVDGELFPSDRPAPEEGPGHVGASAQITSQFPFVSTDPAGRPVGQPVGHEAGQAGEQWAPLGQEGYAVGR